MYCSATEVIGMIKEDMIGVIIGDEFIEDADEKKAKIVELAEDAIRDADAEINGYLAKKYSVPFRENIPPVVVKFSKDIAVYNLVSRTGIDENEREKTFLNRYNAAIRFLESVATGKVEIGSQDSKEKAQTGFSMESSERIFSRSKMRGW